MRTKARKLCHDVNSRRHLQPAHSHTHSLRQTATEIETETELLRQRQGESESEIQAETTFVGKVFRPGK